jgi:hypothetical protein
MGKRCFSAVTVFMKKTLLITLILSIWALAIQAHVVYVDSNIGDDNNPGTEESPFFSIQKAAEIIRSKNNDVYVMKINPGIYILDHPVSVSAEKEMTDKRIVIEATVLPDDTSWTPEKMPVIVSSSKKGEIPEYYHFVASFLINESHVTIRGIKFPGYFYPNTRYFPVARFNKEKTDLLVEQCMFVADRDASHIQVGVIAHGNEIKIDHCVFYNAKNAVVYWEDAGTGSKTGNSFTNCIVYGAFQTAIWTSWPDTDFVFKNNIVSNCKHFWIKNAFNETVYSIENCIVVNNQYYQGAADESGVRPVEFKMNENKITKEGEISLRLIAENVDEPLPIDYLHVIPNSPGYDIGAGLFKYRKQ